MSRGLGRSERAILDYLRTKTADRAVRLDVIADVTGQHEESLRRAMKSLANKGFVTVGRDNGWRVIDDEVTRFWDRSCPTVQLSAGNCSTLTGGAS